MSGKIFAMVCDEKASINFMSTSMNFIVETRKLSALVISFTEYKVCHWVQWQSTFFFFTASVVGAHYLFQWKVIEVMG